jgi:hypothetical protein
MEPVRGARDRRQHLQSEQSCRAIWAQLVQQHRAAAILIPAVGVRQESRIDGAIVPAVIGIT